MKNWSPETKAEYSKKLAERARQRWADPEYKARVGAAISSATKGKKQVSPEQRNAISQSLQGRKIPAEQSKRAAATRLKRQAQGQYAPRKNHGPPTSETRQRISQSLMGHAVADETKEKLSQQSKAIWQDPAYRAKVLEARQTLPNKLEQAITPELLVLGFRYTGNGSFWVHDLAGSRNPDFKQTGQKRVVELWGDYWHQGENPQDLVRWYQEHGYHALVVWEHELRTKTITEIITGWLTDGVLSDDLDGRKF